MEEGECLLSYTVASKFSLSEGDTAYISIDLRRYFQVLSARYEYVRGKKVKLNKTVNFDCRIKGIYEKQGGRFSENQSGIVYMELAHFYKTLAPFIQVEQGDRDDFLDFIHSLNPKEYSNEVNYNLPDPRIDFYLNSDFAEVQSQVTYLASKIIETVGPNALAAWLSVLYSLTALSLSSVFFGIIMNLVIVLLAVLSLMLITTLLLQSIQTKTVQIGTLRMLGVNKCDLFWILLSQALLFSVPALVLGFLFSFPLLKIVSGYFYDSVGYSFSSIPSFDAILITLFLGLLLPAIAVLMPLGATLQTTISDALNFMRSRTRGTLINILNKSKTGVIRSAMLGLIGLAFGGSIYYFLPLGIASSDFPLLTTIFFVLLVAMLLGFSLLALNFQHILEVIVVRVLFCWEKALSRTLILKNLVAHRLQNQKTSLLYTLSIGFTIMIVASYSMQLRHTELMQLKSNGAYLTFFSDDSTIPLCTDCIIGAIQHHPQVVADYSLNTYTPSDIRGKQIRQTIFGDKSGLSNFHIELLGVSANFFQPLLQDFLKVNSRSTSKLSLGEQLYTAKGSQGFGSGIFLQDKTAVSIHNYSETALISLKYPHKRAFLKVHPLWALNQAPVFNMGDRHFGSENVVVSVPFFRRIMGYSSITQIPITSMYIKLQKEATKTQIAEFVNDVHKSYPVEQMKKNIGGFNYEDTKESVEQVQALLDTIFTLVLVIVMLLCFFSLSGAMASNIYHQSKEIAILRAVGLTKKRIIILYIYQAFVIVFSSGLQGLVIGVILGELLVLQQELFVDLPLSFYFPTWELLAMFMTSVFTAVMASCLPARSLLSRQIAEIIRSNA